MGLRRGGQLDGVRTMERWGQAERCRRDKRNQGWCVCVQHRWRLGVVGLVCVWVSVGWYADKCGRAYIRGSVQELANPSPS